MLILAGVLLAMAGLPTAMTVLNLLALRKPAPAPAGTRVAVLIPARDEAAGIAACVEAALASTAVGLEVVVLDDHSADATAAIVAHLARADPRLRLVAAPPLPAGWSGKQHACHVLSRLTDAPLLLFLDADVRLQPDAAARLVGALARSDLVSGVPRQEMVSLPELLVIPMINALLLGYLPIPLARRFPKPALAAGCGQMIAVRADAYARSGGHAAIRTSLHDGLTLPRLFRAAGLRTDLVAGAGLATCRMYTGWRAVVRGATKNAAEGLAKPGALPVWTVLLLGGHVAPWLLLAAALAGGRRG
ncbi:glycosyltransferase family 2 protein, partial [Caulobacter sp. S45]|uniref:glycosyltransferase n=1 Tax=Caulobacter sp. S45 TaxID=1641861 RepID=UPI0015762EE3